MRSIPILLASAATLAACGDNTAHPPTPASCLPDCPAARTYDALSYDLHGRYDWSAGSLIASEDVGLDITASGPIVELDAAVDVTAVHAGDQPLAFAVDAAKGTLAIDVSPVGTTGTVELAIDYTATVDGDTLIATASRDDDPVTSRVVYTDSEPNRAHHWHPVKLDPSDRALWSVDLTVNPDEDVIANGTRKTDQTSAGKRVVGYSLTKPIPAYLMAFAAGQLDHTDRTSGRVPLSVWYRRGLVLDPQATLDAVADAMTTFEALTIPYPWDSYAVVLLPYGGGMENATITFDNETSGQGTIGFTLVAHELAHHWFGDWVTMHGYDDVWFKEGMATVLESEADRARRDREHRGRRWGIDDRYNPSDAIVDDSLIGIDKYTSGPYDRAGWLISQVRATVGEAAFWSGLKAFLAAHALDSATGEQFLRSFQPALDDAAVAKLLAALPKTGTPTITATTTAGGSATTVALSLADPDGLMIAPIDVTVIDAAGAAGPTSHLAAGAPVTASVPTGGYLAVDEGDTHPPWTSNFGVAQGAYAQVRALFAPPVTASAAALATFTSRSAAQQERIATLPIATPAALAGYLDALDSDRARQTAIVAACAAGQTDAAWRTAVQPALAAPYRLVYDTRLSACDAAYARATLAPQLASALAQATPASLARVQYLLSFDYGPDTLSAIGAVATSAPSLVLRDYALYRLTAQVEQYAGYPAIPDAELPAWQHFYEQRLVPSISDNRFQDVLYALSTLGDVAALPAIGALFHTATLSESSEAAAVCQAYALTSGTGSAWTAFQTAAMPFATLPSSVQALLADPTGCNNMKRRAPRPHGKPRG